MVRVLTEIFTPNSPCKSWKPLFSRICSSDRLRGKTATRCCNSQLSKTCEPKGFNVTSMNRFCLPPVPLASTYTSKSLNPWHSLTSNGQKSRFFWKKIETPWVIPLSLSLTVYCSGIARPCILPIKLSVSVFVYGAQGLRRCPSMVRRNAQHMWILKLYQHRPQTVKTIPVRKSSLSFSNTHR